MILCPDNRFSSTWTTLQCQVNISALYIDHLNEVNYQYGIEIVLCKVLVCLADEMVSYLSVTAVAVRWRIVGDMTGWLGSSVVVFAPSAKGPGFEPWSSHNFSPVTCLSPVTINSGTGYPSWSCGHQVGQVSFSSGAPSTQRLPWLPVKIRCVQLVVFNRRRIDNV